MRGKEREGRREREADELALKRGEAATNLNSYSLWRFKCRQYLPES